MSEPTKICRVCKEPRAENQFRKRSGGVRQGVCRRCTKHAARHTAWLAARAQDAA
jgi:hypothetical protein